MPTGCAPAWYLRRNRPACRRQPGSRKSSCTRCWQQQAGGRAPRGCDTSSVQSAVARYYIRISRIHNSSAGCLPCSSTHHTVPRRYHHEDGTSLPLCVTQFFPSGTAGQFNRVTPDTQEPVSGAKSADLAHAWSTGGHTAAAVLTGSHSTAQHGMACLAVGGGGGGSTGPLGCCVSADKT